MTKRLLIVAFVLAAISLTSCSRSFVIRPSGQFGDAITFYFFEHGRDKPSRLGIQRLVVQERKSEREWIIVWEVTGDAALESLTYGVQPFGMKEVVAAEPLSSKAEYQVLASEVTWPNPIGYAQVRFTFDEAGLISILKERN
jgi:hypothetical protein